MPTEKIFDAHFHLLFKHFVTTGKPLTEEVKMDGIAQLLDEISGGPFSSQASPKQISQSSLYLGITSIIAFEHAFANEILHIWKLDLSHTLPLDWDMISNVKNSQVTYYGEFKRQVEFYQNAASLLQGNPYNIEFLRRGHPLLTGKTSKQIVDMLSAGDKRYIVFAIEGGHNLSNVLIHSQQRSLNPELQLQEIQGRDDVDFISMNLCHLSDIPEQRLGGFCQGVNKMSQTAFKSPDFFPSAGIGVSELGKKVIRQALTHPTKPVLIDVKHMSAYTRFHYYRFREKLIAEKPEVARLPIISSHTGLTFTSLADYVKNKNYRLQIDGDEGSKVYSIYPENRLIGKTNDSRNENLFTNPWTIGLFNEEIVEIMQSNGLIGISMDQRVLGASKVLMDGTRPKYFEQEYIAAAEWDKMFSKGQFPGEAEGLFEDLFHAPTRAERHIMLFCTHLVHAARIGYANIAWVEGTSPWDHLSIGSDFDGLINPLNGYDSIIDMSKMRKDLMQYLPVADKYLVTDNKRSLKYTLAGDVDAAFLNEVIDKVLFENGANFIARFLTNWS